eukprot:TRINITY_DN9876_c0_g1_i1.p1 TRINITY_DN9876_c0_g1~~TRINITY_DN9876_c0_g1_i1.p1  ORF type:complete len:316 (+),score=29.87 TRINITY_DN9876_c0_g1_i1:370-1317(+)
MASHEHQFSLNNDGSLAVWDGEFYSTESGRVLGSVGGECRFVECFDRTNAVAVVRHGTPHRVSIVDLTDGVEVSGIELIGEVKTLKVEGLLLSAICVETTNSDAHHLYVFSVRDEGPFGAVKEVYHTKVIGFESSLSESHVVCVREDPAGLIRRDLFKKEDVVIKPDLTTGVKTAISADGSAVCIEGNQCVEILKIDNQTPQPHSTIARIKQVLTMAYHPPTDAFVFTVPPIYRSHSHYLYHASCATKDHTYVSFKSKVFRMGSSPNGIMLVGFAEQKQVTACELLTYSLPSPGRLELKGTVTLTRKPCQDPMAE